MIIFALNFFVIMISKAKIKYIHSLEQKKYRIRENVFVAEGPKVVGDLLASITPKILIHTENWTTTVSMPETEDIVVSETELKKISFLQHPQEVMAVFPQMACLSTVVSPEKDLILALDNIQDPGNLGTIIRVADWFGIRRIVCSPDTVDVYSPKVIQATMGSIARVIMEYTDLTKFIHGLPPGIPIYGTLLDGENIYESNLSSHGVIVMGNEGNGISADIRKLVTNRLLIPNYPKGSTTTDSLNVAIATAITCNEFRRRI